MGGPITGWARVGVFGVGSAFLIYAVVAAESNGRIFSRIRQYLGDASYSIYIWHVPLLTLLIAASEWTGLIKATPPV